MENWKDAFQFVFARKELQGMWSRLHSLSTRGLGYGNWNPEANGEFRLIEKCLAHCSKSGTDFSFFDVGANEGDFSLHVRRMAPQSQIHCFEPNPHTHLRLASRFEGDINTQIHNLGLSDHPGHMDLWEPAPTQGSNIASFLPEVFHEKEGLAQYSVETQTLDDFVAARGIAHITYLKIDVEGYEGAVLKGSETAISRGMIDLIHLEMNHHNCIAGLSIYKLAKMLDGYSIFKILPNGLYPLVSKESPYHEKIESYRLINLACIRNGSPLLGALLNVH